MTKHQVIDNFLPEEDFKTLESIVIKSHNFPWYFTPLINEFHNDNLDSDDKSCYLTHLVYNNMKINSDYFEDFKSILNKLNLKSLIRIKVNFYPNTEKLQIHKPHTDYSYSHKGCILYFNTCNGYTILQDGTKIETVRNRALLFDASLPHSSTSCTDKKARFNVNINYF